MSSSTSNSTKYVEEITNLTKRDIVKHLSDEFPGISPSKNEYKEKYLDYLCSKLSIEKSEVPAQVYTDIYDIKKFYTSSKCSYKVSNMLRIHKKFFDAPVKVKRAIYVPPPMVCFSLNFT